MASSKASRSIGKYIALGMCSICMILLLLALSSCTKDAESGSIQLCSSSMSGEIGNASSDNPSMSADGRYVAFESLATNLTEGDSGRYWDIYRKDLESGEILLCSTSSGGESGNGDSESPAISRDGRYVAFQSSASNLVPDDRNDCRDIFRKDLLTGEIMRCSTSSSGLEGNNDSFNPSINSDGGFIAFHSRADNFVAQELYKTEDQNRRNNVYRKDISTGELVCCSTTPDGELGNGDSEHPSISADGRFVAFESNAKSFVPGEEYMEYRIFRKDLLTGEMILCSASIRGVTAIDHSGNASISFDGRYVAFESYAVNLVLETMDLQERRSRIYRKDTSTGEIVCCSASAGGELGEGDFGCTSLSGDGRYISFCTNSDNLHSGDTNKGINVFRKDLETGEIIMCSTSPNGKPGNSESMNNSISSDGRFVAFGSLATNLVDGDNNDSNDVYRKEVISSQSLR
jgi:Tol biopolymer transport system component